jgi:hypothetical protein
VKKNVLLSHYDIAQFVQTNVVDWMIPATLVPPLPRLFLHPACGCLVSAFQLPAQ